MALTNVYTQVYGQLPEFFSKIREGQAPQQFTQQLLKDLGFKSSNHRALIPLLKALGFISQKVFRQVVIIIIEIIQNPSL